MGNITAVMGLLSPHRRFRDPGNLEGIPGVHIHKPAPARDQPLPGTKGMLTPRDGSLKMLLNRATRRVDHPSRTANVLGCLSVAGVVGLLSLLWFVWRNPEVDEKAVFGGMFWGVIILALGGIHILAIFSQILSGGHNMPGAVSLVLLYAGMILLAVADHLLR